MATKLYQTRRIAEHVVVPAGTQRIVDADLLADDGSAVDLTGVVAVTAQVRNLDTGRVHVEEAATVLDAANGSVRHVLNTFSTAIPGKYDLRFLVQEAGDNGAVTAYPERGGYQIRVTAYTPTDEGTTLDQAIAGAAQVAQDLIDTTAAKTDAETAKTDAETAKADAESYFNASTAALDAGTSLGTFERRPTSYPATNIKGESKTAAIGDTLYALDTDTYSRVTATSPLTYVEVSDPRATLDASSRVAQEAPVTIDGQDLDASSLTLAALTAALASTDRVALAGSGTIDGGAAGLTVASRQGLATRGRGKQVLTNLNLQLYGTQQTAVNLYESYQGGDTLKVDAGSGLSARDWIVVQQAANAGVANRFEVNNESKGPISELVRVLSVATGTDGGASDTLTLQDTLSHPYWIAGEGPDAFGAVFSADAVVWPVSPLEDIDIDLDLDTSGGDVDIEPRLLVRPTIRIRGSATGTDGTLGDGRLWMLYDRTGASPGATPSAIRGAILDIEIEADPSATDGRNRFVQIHGLTDSHGRIVTRGGREDAKHTRIYGGGRNNISVVSTDCPQRVFEAHGDMGSTYTVKAVNAGRDSSGNFEIVISNMGRGTVFFVDVETFSGDAFETRLENYNIYARIRARQNTGDARNTVNVHGAGSKSVYVDLDIIIGGTAKGLRWADGGFDLRADGVIRTTSSAAAVEIGDNLGPGSDLDKLRIGNLLVDRTGSTGIGVLINNQAVNRTTPEINVTNSITSPAITASGLTATVAWTAHGMSVDDTILVVGFDQTEYNGAWRVDSVPDANTLTYTMLTAPSTSPATSSTTAYAWTGHRIRTVYIDHLVIKGGDDSARALSVSWVDHLIIGRIDVVDTSGEILINETVKRVTVLDGIYSEGNVEYDRGALDSAIRIVTTGTITETNAAAQVAVAQAVITEDLRFTGTVDQTEALVLGSVLVLDAFQEPDAVEVNLVDHDPDDDPVGSGWARARFDAATAAVDTDYKVGNGLRILRDESIATITPPSDRPAVIFARMFLNTSSDVTYDIVPRWTDYQNLIGVRFDTALNLVTLYSRSGSTSETTIATGNVTLELGQTYDLSVERDSGSSSTYYVVRVNGVRICQGTSSLHNSALAFGLARKSGDNAVRFLRSAASRL